MRCFTKRSAPAATGAAHERAILTETRERVARIEIARPEKKNALTGESTPS